MLLFSRPTFRKSSGVGGSGAEEESFEALVNQTQFSSKQISTCEYLNRIISFRTIAGLFGMKPKGNAKNMMHIKLLKH
jgi:hypothetical protein